MAEPSQPVLMGIDFRSAGLRLRDAMSFGSDETAAVLEAAAKELPLQLALLSTCNRTEFYLMGPAVDTDPVGLWLDWLGSRRSRELLAEVRRRAYRRAGSAAAQHLYRVACGLESAVLGDVQVQGQVRDAMQLAETARTLGETLRQLFTGALRAGRRARAETAIARGAPTVGGALADLLQGRLVARTASSIVILGAGRVAGSVARQLAKRHLGPLRILNRTRARAAALAARCRAECGSLEQLEAALRTADVVVAATRAPSPMLTRPMLQAAARGRRHRLIVIDAGLPANVEPCDAVDVIDVDAVRETQQRDQDVRTAAVPAVEAIIAEELTQWVAWARRQPVERLIRSLYQRAATLSKAEASALSRLSPTEAEHALFTTFKHLLHQHVRDLRTLPIGSGPSGRTD